MVNNVTWKIEEDSQTNNFTETAHCIALWIGVTLLASYTKPILKIFMKGYNNGKYSKFHLDWLPGGEGVNLITTE